MVRTISDDEALDVLTKAARAGGEKLTAHFGKTTERTIKNNQHCNFATRADYQSEETILNVIRAAWEDVNIFAEESGKLDKHSPYTVVIDPLDGTHNFALGIPVFTISLALLYKRKTVAGVVFHPLINSLFCATQGNGTTRGETSLSVSSLTDFTKAIISFACGYGTPFAIIDKIQQALHKKKITRFMVNWAPAFELCLLAQGSTASFIALNIEPYDFLAGKLIAEEAGARVTMLPQHSPQKGTFIASTPAIHEELVALIKPLIYAHRKHNT